MKPLLIVLGIIIIIWIIYAIIPTYILKLITRFQRKKEGSKIYLTFDDGPSEKYTNDLLDLLKKYNIKATFFVVATFANNNPKIINRMKREGHEIGLHSLSHKNALLMSPLMTYKDIKKSIEITKDLDLNIKYFRAPWGHFNLMEIIMIKKANLKIKLWNVMAEDWEANTTSEKICNKILKRTNGGDIICLHDGRGKNEAPSRTIKALETAIPILLEKGFKFEVIG